MKTLKRSLLIIFAVFTLMAIFCFGASALSETGQCGDDVYWSYNSETQELVISGNGAMWDYEINYDDHNGISIATSPFFDSESIDSVVVENGVTTIGDYAFWDCNSLKSVTIGNSVTTIGCSAFYECTFLQSVKIGKGVSEIGDKALDCCARLQSITIDNENNYYSSDDHGVLFDKNKNICYN